jgi:hypothetical protein
MKGLGNLEKRQKNRSGKFMTPNDREEDSLGGSRHEEVQAMSGCAAVQGYQQLTFKADPTCHGVHRRTHYQVVR